MKFIIESSLVPIYNRIAAALSKTLIEFGHTVHFIKAIEFTEIDFINIINDIEIDYYISTNELNFIQKKSSFEDYFIFERINSKLIFIHHDNLFSAFNNIDFISSKINPFVNASSRSIHFFLEVSNIKLLNSFGITSAHKINHSSEFTNSLNKTTAQWNVTFIGHLMSSLNLYPTQSLMAGHHLLAAAWNRLCQSSYAIQPQITNLLKDPYFTSTLSINSVENLVAVEQFLIAELNKLSSPMRGQLISKIKNHRIDIFGGDLSYGKFNDPLMKIKQDNIFYQNATDNYQDACEIYQNSRININITSLQFDTALNNRFYDVIFAGGFILTDNRSDINSIFPFASEICYETPEELIEKVSYWSSNSNNVKYSDIKIEMQFILKNNFSYQHTVSNILNKI